MQATHLRKKKKSKNNSDKNYVPRWGRGGENKNNRDRENIVKN